MKRWLDALAAPVLALLALGASVVGLTNQFVYDDRYIIRLNPAVASLHHWWRLFGESYWPVGAGGDGYRPLTILAFSVEWALGHHRPLLFHAVNLTLYVVVALLVFQLAQLMLPRWIAWIVAALFAVHPVHVEAVANGVGQEELWVAVAMISAVVLYVRGRRRGPLRPWASVAIVALYACACFFKEHGIVLPGLLAVCELLLVPDARSVRVRAREMRPFILALVAVAIGFLAAHSAVLASHGLTGFNEFVPFQTLKLSARDRILTMFGVLPQWIRLFYWPARLRSEYAPPDITIAQGFSVTQVPGMILLAAVLGLAVVAWRKRPVLALGIAWTVITLLPSSNFIVPAGIILAERTLFLPSVGAMLIAGDLIWWLAPRLRRPSLQPAGLALVGVLIALGLARSESRSRVWHDNTTLLTQAVADAPDSYRAHYMLSVWYGLTNRTTQSEREGWTALRLFPYDPFLSFGLAESYQKKRVCRPAADLYAWTFALSPKFALGHQNYAVCLMLLGRYTEARQQAFIAMGRAIGTLPQLHQMVAVADSVLHADSLSGRGVRLTGSTGKVPEPPQKTGTSSPQETASPPRKSF